MGHFKMKLFSAATAVIIVCIQYSSGKHFLVQTKDTDYDEDPSAADYSYARPSTSAPSSYARPSTTAPKSKYGDYSYARPSTTAPRSKYGSDYDYSSYSRPSYSRSGDSSRRSYGGSTRSSRRSNYGA